MRADKSDPNPVDSSRTASTTGTLSVNVVPCPGSELTSREPLRRPTAVRTTSSPTPRPETSLGTGVVLTPPRVRLTAETEREFYRRQQKTVTIRHVSGDRIVAMVEVVSPGNKSGRHALRSFVEKAAELLDQGIHLLILDLLPPGRRDPHGIHGAIWEEIAGEDFNAPPDKPPTLAAYETALTVKAYVEPVAVGDALKDMPLFLEPGAHVAVPLEATYAAAFAAVPRRWRTVLEGTAAE